VVIGKLRLVILNIFGFHRLPQGATGIWEYRGITTYKNKLISKSNKGRSSWTIQI
jgi:hypothetical protein